MACNQIQSWTFSGLVGAFLDLAIAFLLLCASTLAYLASKFLGLFGSCLPCPCNGVFGVANSEKCWQRVLVHSPLEKICSVQFSVKRKFPFDSIWDQNLNPQSNIRLVNKKNHENGCVGLDDQASCSSFQERNEMGRDVKEERFDIKGKGVSYQKGRHALRRRWKASTDNERFSSVSSYDSFQLDAQASTPSPASVAKMVNESNEGTIAPDSSGDDALFYGMYSSMDMDFLGRKSSGFESNEPMDENKPTDKDVSPVEDLKFNAQGVLSCGSDEKNVIRVLEQALEEEHTACAALYLELEKERSAAASAADEAMAMILRLQEEKASIEMDARQYQRMIEEKAAYDIEEMNILKEILLRREREKHFLENEVETYRQMIFESEQLDADAQDTGTSCSKRASLLLYSGEDPMLVLQSITNSFCESEKVENANKISEHGARSIGLQDCTLSFGKEESIPELDKVKQECISRDPTINKSHQHLSGGNGEINEEFEEMKLLSPEKSQFPLEREVKSLEMHSELKLSTAEGYNLHGKPVASVGEVQRQSDVIGTCQNLPSNSTETCEETKNVLPSNYDDSQKDDEDDNRMFNMCPHAHDVHASDDKFILCGELGESESEKFSENIALDIPQTCDSPAMSRSLIEKDISRSCSGITSGLPPLGCSQRKPLLSDFRRNSMSAIDYERFKIDNEIGWLRERLRIIQEGREKLNISMEHREKENVQLQLLENIVNQLQETRQLTETGNAVRQISLPPPSCKIMSMKRRWRSVSLEVHRRT